MGWVRIKSTATSKPVLLPTYMNVFPTPDNYKSIELYNGARIAYTDEGKGNQTIVFVHGLGTYGQSWQHNIKSLKKHYRCIALDLPGNGYSDDEPRSYSLHFFAKCLLDFIGRLGLDRVVLMGHSMGGQVAMLAVLEAPGSIDKLVLCAPAGFERFSIMEKWLFENTMHFAGMLVNDEESLRQSVRNSFYKNTTQGDGMINELIALMRKRSMSAYKRMIDGCIKGMINETVFTRLKEINQPALVLFGEQDALIPNKLLHLTSTEAVAKAGTKELKKGKLILLPRCGHFLQWEKAAEVNKLVHQWIG